MWKAIWTGLAGLLLGVVLGESFGGAQGAVLGTVAGAVLGAPPAFVAARRCRTPCRGCRAVCVEPKRSSLPAMMTAAAVTVAVMAGLSAVVPLLPAVTITLLAMCAAGVVVVRHLVLYGRARKPRPVRRPVARPALTRGPLAIEAPKPAIRSAIITERERTGHANS